MWWRRSQEHAPSTRQTWRERGSDMTSLSPDAKPGTEGTAIAPDGTAQVARLPLLGGLKISRGMLLSTLPIYIGLILIWIYFDIQTDGKFLSARNISNMVQQFSYKPALALGIVL